MRFLIAVATAVAIATPALADFLILPDGHMPGDPLKNYEQMPPPPADGQIYGLSDGAWTVVPPDTSGTVSEDGVFTFPDGTTWTHVPSTPVIVQGAGITASGGTGPDDPRVYTHEPSPPIEVQGEGISITGGTGPQSPYVITHTPSTPFDPSALEAAIAAIAPDDSTANGTAAFNGTDLEITFDDGGSATVDVDCAFPAFDNLRRAGDDIVYDLCDGDTEREFYSFRNAGVNWTAGAFETAPTGEYLLGSQAVQFNNRSAADVRVFCTMTTGVEFLPGTSGIKYVVSLYENGTEVAGNGGTGIDQTDGNATQHVRDVTHSGTWTWLMPPGISLVEVFAEFDEQAAGLPTIWAGGARISTGGVVCVWNYGGEI